MEGEMNPHWLPGLIPWNQEHGETWEQYEQRLFHVFQNEFRESFQYDGKPVHYKRMPYDGIYPEAFMHLTTCNQDNSGSRLPDAERSERISWPRPVVEHHPFCEICEYTQCTQPWVWRKNDKNKDRVKIYLPNQQYLVVLGERRDYWVLITAYYVNRQWSIDKLEKEYNSRFSTKIQ